jgi:hypothetical protein
MGAKNLRDDTKTVQELLNNVPAAEGGPVPLLETTTGVCGQLTISAIQKFQLKHFGWKGADGRVDPDGPTLHKLNQFDKKVAPPPPVLPPPPRVVFPTSKDFFLIHMSPKKVSAGRPEDLFFLLSDITNNRLAVYWLDAGRRGKPHVPAPAGETWSGSGGRFATRKPRRIDDLAVPAAWHSREQNGNVTSKLVLFFPEGGVTIPMNHHLIGPGGQVSSSKSGGGGVATAAAGDFRLVEFR